MITFSSALNALLVGSPSARAAKLRQELASSSITIGNGASAIYPATSVAPTLLDQNSLPAHAQYTGVRWKVTSPQAFTGTATTATVRIASASDPTKYLESVHTRVGDDGYFDRAIASGDTAEIDVVVRFVENDAKTFWFGPNENAPFPPINFNPHTWAMETGYDVAPNTLVTSDEYIALGIDNANIKQIQVSSGGININNTGWQSGGAWVDIKNGDKFRVRYTTGAGPNDSNAEGGQGSGVAIFAKQADGDEFYGVGTWFNYYDNRRSGNAVQTWNIGPARTYTQLNQCRDLIRAGDTIEFDYNNGIPYENFEIRRCGSPTLPITIRCATPNQRAVIGLTTLNYNSASLNYPSYRLAFIRSHWAIIENLEFAPLAGLHLTEESKSTVTVNVVSSGGTATPVITIVPGGTTQSITIPANTPISLKAIHSADSSAVFRAVVKWTGASGGVMPGNSPFVTTEQDGFVETLDPNLPAKTAFTSGGVGTYTLSVGIDAPGKVYCILLKGANTVVRETYMHDSGGGLLQQEFGTGSLDFYRNKVINCGNSRTQDPYSHPAYLNFDAAQFPNHYCKAWGNFIYDFGGGGIGSRARHTEIFANWIESSAEQTGFGVQNPPFIWPLNSKSAYCISHGGHDDFSQGPASSAGNFIYSNVVIARNGFSCITGGDSVSETWGRNWIAYNSFLIDPPIGGNLQSIDLLRFRINVSSAFYANNIVGFLGGATGALSSAMFTITSALPYGWAFKPFLISANNHLPGAIGYRKDFDSDLEFETRHNEVGNVTHTGAVYTNQTFGATNMTPLTPIVSYTGPAPALCVPIGYSATQISSPTVRCWSTRPSVDGAPLPPLPTGAPKTTAGAI